MNRNIVFTIMMSYLAAFVLIVAPAQAGFITLPFSENFNSPAPSADVTVDYPVFTPTLNGGTATVDSSGVLHLNGPAGDTTQTLTVTPFPAPTSEIVIMAKVGGNATVPGNFNVGLVLGQNNLVFHPGLAGGGIQGFFRIDGPGGFGNSDMGFTPASGVLHQVEIHSFPSGLFTIKLTDGANPLNIYLTNFTNPASYGGDIGPGRRQGFDVSNGGEGIYDDFSVSLVPEPSTLALAGLGLIALVGRGLRRRWA